MHLREIRRYKNAQNVRVTRNMNYKREKRAKWIIVAANVGQKVEISRLQQNVNSLARQGFRFYILSFCSLLFFVTNHRVT